MSKKTIQLHKFILTKPIQKKNLETEYNLKHISHLRSENLVNNQGKDSLKSWLQPFTKYIHTFSHFAKAFARN